MQVRRVKIIGTSKYLPSKTVTAEELDEKLGTQAGWVRKKTGVETRYYAESETASEMGAKAVRMALEGAGLTFADIDCLVSASGTSEQAIPSTAALIQKVLGEGDSGIPAFDIDSTCLSFVVGLDVLSYLIEAGRYECVLLVSSEIASIGLDWSHKESAALFGDGAAAVIIGKAKENETSRIISSSMETYGAGAEFSQIRGGGTKLHPRNTSQIEPFLFEMNGKAIYKMAAKRLPNLVNAVLRTASSEMKDIDLVIPHQASMTAMKLISKKLGISDEQLMNISPTHGNTIAASIPMALHEAIKQQRIKRGERILLLGTSAGLSVGGMVLEY